MLAELGPVNGFFEFALPASIRWDQQNFKGDSYPGYSWSANVAEIEVDPLTFEIEVKRVTAVVDVGRIINPTVGVGPSRRRPHPGARLCRSWRRSATGQNGLYDAARLQTYIIPTALDIPEYDVKFVEYPCSFAPPGAKGLGELPMDGLAPAIANAVEAAIGQRIRTLPITPESIFAALHAGPRRHPMSTVKRTWKINGKSVAVRVPAARRLLDVSPRGSRAHRLQGELRRRRMRRLHRHRRQRADGLLHHSRRTASRRHGDSHHRRHREEARRAPAPAGLSSNAARSSADSASRAWSSAATPSWPRIPSPPRRRSAKDSPATSAAAPAIPRSSPP